MTHIYIDVPISAPSAPAIETNVHGGSNVNVVPTTLIEMTLSAENLINADVLSKSDPYCVIQIKEESWQEKYCEIGRTEIIKDNLNPEWVKKFLINFNFETVQKIRFEVWDHDTNGNDFLGEYETTLADIVSNSGRQFKGKLNHKSARNAGHIIIVTEEVAACKKNIQIEFHAKHLEKKSWFVRNDPYLVLYRSNENDGSSSIVARTEVAPSTQNPKWDKITTKVRTLCNGDYERSIKIECYDNRSNGDHKLIGTCHTCLNKLSKGPGDDNIYALRNPKKQHKKEHSGFLELISISISDEVSFLDYIRAGTQVHFAVAIDFTASNKPATDPQSLHYLSPQRPNSYEIALKSVFDIISHYDTSNMYPAFGFGAKLPPSNEVSHQFPLNDNVDHPYCSSIEEIMVHYRRQLNTVQLFGPCNFSPVINNTISIAKQYQDGKHYFVLLIITDGIISDIKHTINAIIDASKLPISIIIVGVGDADFGAMDELDSDDCRLSINGRTAERDIVQFVPLNQFLTGQHVRCQADLGKAVLAEIPDQITGFMKSKGFKPNLPTDNSDVK
ncbi:copine-8-like [Contarinia nasturtii]|uniref:copine-8-like n=1 Tax=Contarinia nasturtii TaxID=265458 RepID=UPI0012D4C105|nr:copine-8-like [Contarinia nasturtii]